MKGFYLPHNVTFSHWMLIPSVQLLPVLGEGAISTQDEFLEWWAITWCLEFLLEDAPCLLFSIKEALHEALH